MTTSSFDWPHFSEVTSGQKKFSNSNPLIKNIKK